MTTFAEQTLKQKTMKPQRTVTIPLEEYDELKGFKDKLDNENSITFRWDSDWYKTTWQTISKDEAIKKLHKINKVAIDQLEEAREENKQLKAKVGVRDIRGTSEINEVKKMTAWQFMKWRKQ